MTKIAQLVARYQTAEGRAKTGLLGPIAQAVKAILKQDVGATTNDDRNDLKSVLEIVKPELKEQIEARLAELETPVETKVRGRKLNPDSKRQTIIKILAASPEPMTTAQIAEKLKEEGVEIKWLHSHIAYFKEKGQVVHGEDKTYKLSASMKERIASLGYQLATV